MVRAICDQAPADDSCLHQSFPKTAQFDFGLSVAKRMGYDSERGRLDKTHHPFCTKFSAGDVRITTRVNEHDLGDALFSTLHEAGHAMYEQGVSAALEGTPLGRRRVGRRARKPVAAVGERRRAQPRLLGALLPGCCSALFPISSRACRSTTFYRAINKVARSLIRTDADEVTYNLHVMLRFDLELKLLEGTAAREGLAGGVARRDASRPRHRAARRSRRLPAGRALVRRRHRRRIPELHDRQYPGRAVLRGGAEGASGHSGRDRARPVRHAARLAAREHLPARRQIRAERAASSARPARR